ncbi:hypothetical protein [Actinoplanes sp. NPDC049265]|uniref:hypothetical protein n=1 Tax=Actinoplanes sp. NPDC049265 TaxID=3363902 RepID=UPI0037179D79
MTNHHNQLREAMVAHEHLAPEPAAVYARVQDLAKAYKRRRLIAQTAGGAVLGAAALVGAFQIPNLIPGQTAPSGGTAIVQPAAPQVSASPAAPSAPAPPADDESPFTDKEQKARDKYFAAGYGVSEAEKLGKIWKLKDIDDVKVKAGKELLAGRKLPVKASTEGVQSAKEEAQVNAFFEKGYDVDDAVELAQLWKLPSTYDAKVAGGKKILSGETLPIKP